ncbi:MAG: AraC family transcriptional regulator [Spirochaetaceae bacterium]
MHKYTNIDIKSTGIITHPKGYLESRSISDYNFWVILEGEIELTVKDKVYNLLPGNILFFFPDVDYVCSYIDNSRIRYNHFVLNKADIFGVIDHYPSCVHLKNSRYFNRLLTTGELWDKKSPWGRIYYTASIAELFDELEDVNKPLRLLMSPNNLLLYELDNYIQNHIGEKLTSGKIAGHFGKSSNYFSDQVKELCGESLGRHVNRVKMNHAKILLKKTEMKIYEIAQSLGFYDSYSFSKAFKNFQGESPTFYKSDKKISHSYVI